MEREDRRSKAETGVGSAGDGREGERTGDAQLDPIRYRLWVGPLQAISEDIEFSYYDSRRGYLFLLTDKAPSGRFVLMTEELMAEMDDFERAWYNRSCFVINGRWVAEHEEESRERVESFLADFEAELRKEAEKIKEHDDGEKQNSRAGNSPDGD